MAGFNVFDPDTFSDGEEVADNTLFKSATDFSHFVEVTAVNNSLTRTQVILDYCEAREIDYLQIANLLSPTLREKIAFEMQEAGLMPSHTVLEFE